METITIKFPESAQFNDDQLFDFCVANEGLRIERDSNGQLIIMSPVGALGSSLNLTVGSLLWLWNSQSNMGIAFDSSGGFRLPNGAMRAPDAAWISHQRWDKLSSQEKQKFAPITPDFIIEIRSESDSLKDLKNKMQEWIDNGCRLAWLIDPIALKAHVYRPGAEVQTIQSFDQRIEAAEVVPGFSIDLSVLK
jgi:Uma2 family endonuclease